MRRIREWFRQDPTRGIVVALFALVALAYCSKPGAAQLQPVQCMAMGSIVADVVVLREIGGDVEKHLTLLRRINPEVAEELHDAMAPFIRRGYADRGRDPESFGNEATADCLKRGGRYETRKRL